MDPAELEKWIDNLAAMAGDRADLKAVTLALMERAVALSAIDVAREAAAPAYKVPGPYEIALTIAAALISSRSMENTGAAMSAAWTGVLQFYEARDEYVNLTYPQWRQMHADAAAAIEAAGHDH